MCPNYRAEMYDILTRAATASQAVHLEGVIWDASEPAAKRVKEAESRATNFRMMLQRLIRAVESGKGVEDKVEKAKSLLGRLSRPEDILR